jgi:hypothetical protein
LPYYYYYRHHHHRCHYYYFCFSWGRVMYKLWAFLECPYKSVVEDFNCQNCTTHKAGVSNSRPPRPPGTLKAGKRWTRSLQPSQLFCAMLFQVNDLRKV